MTYVLDAVPSSGSLIRKPRFDWVRDLLMQAAKGEIELLLSAVNWGEIAGALYKRAGELKSAITKAGTLASNLAALPVTIVTADKDHAEAAAIFKCDFKVPFADAFAGSLALRESATLVTADFDFKSVPSGTIAIEFLPTK
jgi:predicted nucleic acid-binding protein